MIIHLKGWEKPLPEWLAKAVEDGKITVHHDKYHDYLIGEIVNPNGLVISFK